MASSNVVTQWITALPLALKLPAGYGIYDQQRLAAYSLYENIYKNVPATFKLTSRGTEDNPIYIPDGRAIVEACNRYLAVGFDYRLSGGTPADQLATTTALDLLFRREEFFSKFVAQKRYGLIRGDTVWHIRADQTKPLGQRISLYELDPALYFPIHNPDDPDRLDGAYLVDTVTDPKDVTKSYTRRQAYRRVKDANGNYTGPITYEEMWYDAASWDDRPVYLYGAAQTLKLIQVITPPTVMPGITSVPLYHIPNSRASGESWGNSELQGMERLFAATNQAVSDEELALALAGLGAYTTNSGPPRDAANNQLDWDIGPGAVIELKGDNTTFQRIQGITSVTPVQDHLKFLLNALQRATGTPDIALGAVDVQVAASGIALTLQMAPLLSKNAEKEQEILAIYDHMFYDLANEWLPTYEQLPAAGTAGISVEPTVADPLPVDRTAILAEVTQMVAAGFMTIEQGRQILGESLGYSFGDGTGDAVLEERRQLAEAGDPFGVRLLNEQGETPQAPFTGPSSAPSATPAVSPVSAAAA